MCLGFPREQAASTQLAGAWAASLAHLALIWPPAEMLLLLLRAHGLRLCYRAMG